MMVIIVLCYVCENFYIIFNNLYQVKLFFIVCYYIMTNNESCINALGFIFNESKFCFNKKNNTIKLKKKNFLMSGLTVSIDKEDAWNGLLNSIDNLINSNLIIVVTKCGILHSLTVKLICVKYCEEKEELTLNVLYPIYKKNKTCKLCVKVCGKLPIIYNYLPNESNNNESIQNYANLTYNDLKNTCYKNVKFYYDDKYSFSPCFISV